MSSSYSFKQLNEIFYILRCATRSEELNETGILLKHVVFELNSVYVKKRIRKEYFNVSKNSQVKILRYISSEDFFDDQKLRHCKCVSTFTKQHDIKMMTNPCMLSSFLAQKEKVMKSYRKIENLKAIPGNIPRLFELAARAVGSRGE